MSFKIRRAGHVVLRVADVERTKDFLETVVGFTTYGKVGRNFYFLTSHPVSNHHMIAIRPGQPGERMPDAARQIGMVSVAYEMTDLAALRDLHHRMSGPAARRCGCSVLAVEDRGSIYNLVASDADGNGYEFWCRAPEGHEGGTASLELRGPVDLAAATGSPPPSPPSRMAIRRTSHLTLRCRDMDRSRAFYEQALDLFAVASDERGRSYLSGDPQTRRIVLALEPAADVNVPLPAPKSMLGMEHYSLEVGSFAELQDAYRRFKSLGIPIDHTQHHGVTASVYFTDPDGNLMEFYQDVPRAEIPVPEDPFASTGEIADRLEASV